MSDAKARLKGSLTAPGLDLDEVRRATELLEAVIGDRGLLAQVPLEMRQALLIAAGRASRPESYQEKRLVKALRKPAACSWLRAATTSGTPCSTRTTTSAARSPGNSWLETRSPSLLTRRSRSECRRRQGLRP